MSESILGGILGEVAKFGEAAVNVGSELIDGRNRTSGKSGSKSSDRKGKDNDDDDYDDYSSWDD